MNVFTKGLAKQCASRGIGVNTVELATAYVFLASPESNYVIGETLNVDGGLDSP